MGINTNAVGDVLPYDWLDARLKFLRLDEGEKFNYY
jgi:hypothetical protein